MESNAIIVTYLKNALDYESNKTSVIYEDGYNVYENENNSMLGVMRTKLASIA